MKIPAHAIHCGLYDCTPAGGDEWSLRAIEFITSMSIGSELSMYVERISPASGIHEVYLRRVKDKNGSLNEALVFLNCASSMENTMHRPEKDLFTQTSHQSKKSVFKDVVINKGDIFEAKITHVNTPSDFYVQQIIDGEQPLQKLMRELKLTYSLLKQNEEIIYNPKFGMPVAVKMANGEWRRGLILGIPKPLCVKVKYVDFGNYALVSWEDIRTLQPKFLRMAAQALRCSLIDVVPKHQNGWSISAKKAFRYMTGKKAMFQAAVEEIRDNLISIVLYETTAEKHYCLNGQLVKKGHALSVGQRSAQPYYLRTPNETPNEKAVTDSDSTTSSVKHSDKLQAKQRASLSKTEDHTTSKISLESSDTYQTIAESEQENITKIKVKVLKLESPGSIYVTFENVSKQLIRLSSEMTQFYNLAEEEVRDWSEGDKCAVLRSADKKWYRGLIADVSSNKFKVFIKDIVEVVEVSGSQLRSLENQFTTVMDGSVKCHMSSVKPPGKLQSWPLGARDFLNNFISQYSDIYINKLGDFVEDSLPVQLWAKKVITGGPLDPIKENWIDVGQALIDTGFALSSENLETDDLILPDPDTTEEQRETVMNWLQKQYQIDEQDMEPEIKKQTKHYKTSIPKHISTMEPNMNMKWKPAEPFKKLDFIGIPTYVDYDCAVYIQDKERNLSTLELIQRGLDTVFAGTALSLHDEDWFAGQICIAFYEPDGKWYRGEVKNVRENDIEVMFVDYGNVESLQRDQIRKNIVMGHIPLQCHRCLTQGMIPMSADGKWPIKALDFVHGTIVEKECRIRLKPPATKGKEYVLLNLNVPGGEDLMEVLVSMHFATYVIDCNEVGKVVSEEEELTKKEIVEDLQPFQSLARRITNSKVDFLQGKLDVPSEIEYKSSPHNQSEHTYDWYDNMIQTLPKAVGNKPGFKELLIPDSLVELQVTVAVVASSTSIKIIICECDDLEVMSILNDFAKMQENIQKEAEDMSYVVPVAGLPCVGCYTEDDTWYRALIKEIFLDSNSVHVLYVDYGNEEMLPIERLRQLKSEWTQIPMQSILVTLHNVCEGPNYDSDSFQEQLMSCLSSPPYTMVVLNKQPTLEVELYDNSNGAIAYQALFDTNIISKQF